MNRIEQLRISGKLPSPKGVALTIMEISLRENATLSEVSKVVQTDPALSSRLLRLATRRPKRVGHWPPSMMRSCASGWPLSVK